MNEKEFSAILNEVRNIFEQESNVFYHGSTTDIKTFVDDFVGKGNDQYGPGIYFSSNRDDTLAYTGDNGYVYKCKLDTSKQLSSKSPYNQKICLDMMVASPDEYAYTDWDESLDKNKAAKNALKTYIDSYGKDMYEILMQIWYDWYRDYPKDFVRHLVKNNFDCTLHDSNTGSTFVVVYNPAIISFIDKVPAQQLIDAQ